MPRFAYSAIDTTGATVEGVTKAESLGAARSFLVDRHLHPVELAERRGLLQFEITKEKVKKKELMHFTRQLGVFVRAGIPITSALETIGDETQDVALRRAIVRMVHRLRNGGTLSDAAAEHPNVFPAYYVGILRSAELTGRLDRTLDDLAGYLNREIETRAKVVNALSYPGVVMVLAIMTVAILAGYVLPKFEPLFEELNADLPLPTRMLLAMASLFTDLVFVPLGAVLCATIFVIWLTRSERGRRTKDRLVLRIPVVKGIVEYAILERFCRILGAMVRAGVPLPDGMKTTTDATTNTVYRDRLAAARNEMLEGSGFAAPLAATELFPGAARQMFKVGEETGTLDEQLEAASEYFDTELEVRIKRFTTMFEPIMIIGVGLMVGFVAVALVSAMYGVLGGVKDGV